MSACMPCSARTRSVSSGYSVDTRAPPAGPHAAAGEVAFTARTTLMGLAVALE